MLLLSSIKYTRTVGVDTGVVDKETDRPGFMQHFDQKEEAIKKKGGRSKAPSGPHDISFYFPDIPDGMDFRVFVSIEPFQFEQIKPYGRSMYQRVLMVQIQRFYESLEGSLFRWNGSILKFVTGYIGIAHGISKQAKNRLLILTHHLKGLSLSFQ